MSFEQPPKSATAQEIERILQSLSIPPDEGKGETTTVYVDTFGNSSGWVCQAGCLRQREPRRMVRLHVEGGNGRAVVERAVLAALREAVGGAR